MNCASRFLAANVRSYSMPAAGSWSPSLCAVIALSILGGSSRAQTTERVSVDSSGAQGNGHSGDYGVQVSSDGRYVVFTSKASNLVPNDTNGSEDIFVRDRVNGTTERVSVSTSGAQANGLSINPSMTPDGRYVAFETQATNLDPNLDTNGQPDVIVRDRLLGFTQRVSVTSTGAQGNLGAGLPAISGDGRYVSFHSYSTNFLVTDTNGNWGDVFAKDRQTGALQLVSLSTAGVQGNLDSPMSALSYDGRYVAFCSYASNLVANDTNGVTDIFVRDRQLGTTERVSTSSGFGGAQANDYCWSPAISPDGRFVVFWTRASTLVSFDTNGVADVFIRDRQTGTTDRVSQLSDATQGNGDSTVCSISADGRFVTFFSWSNNWIANDSNGAEDVYLRDRATGTMERVSVSTSGMQANSANYSPSISADGRYVGFFSWATNLVPNDSNGVHDVFLRDRGDASISPVFCFGDISVGPCPCNNIGWIGHGCDNSSFTGGAVLTAAGNAMLSGDTLVFTAAGEKATALSVLLQGNTSIAPANYGDGLRCAGGTLKRLLSKNAVGGVVTMPQSGDPTISSASAALGDAIAPGSTRVYQIYYRDANASFCPSPSGDTFNISGAVLVTWGG